MYLLYLLSLDLLLFNISIYIYIYIRRKLAIIIKDRYINFRQNKFPLTEKILTCYTAFRQSDNMLPTLWHRYRPREMHI